MAKKRHDVLVLTGAAGVGKSTIAKLWAQRRMGAHVVCDEIRHWIQDHHYQRAKAHQESLIAEVATTAAIQFMHQNMDVALDNVWTPSGIKILHQNLRELARVRFVYLTCSPEINHKRDQLRKGDDVMGARVDELRRELEAYRWPAGVVLMETSLDSLEQTLERVEALFAGGVV